MISMKSISSSDKNYLSEKHNLLVFGLFMDDKNKFKQTELDSKLGNIISSTLKLEKFNGDYKRTILLYGNDQYTRILYVGLGERNDYCTDRSRSLGSILTKHIDELKLKEFSIDGDTFKLNDKSYAQAFTEGLVLGSYSFNDYKTSKENTKLDKECIIYGKDPRHEDIAKGTILGHSVCFARDLGNHPPNILTPNYLAESAKKIADKSSKMSTEIFNLEQIKKMGMGAFYGVAMGAKEPAKLIIVEYNGGNKKDKPLALVGKGLTFDSGGISIKPSPKMDEMKFDMCGSSTVMGVLKAVANLKPKINLIFAIGSTENMPGGNAQRPGDIVTAYNGKTIEVLNTDAEGRLVLADVLSYVNSKYKPSAILDFATLTGAVLIALGNRASGVMGNNIELMDEVKNASNLTSEKVWELPLWEEYTSEIKGKYADIQNIGQARLAGTITAGAFLKEFVENTPWVHIDIAGTAWGPKEPAYQPNVGATGVAVRLVYKLIENRMEM